MMERLRELFVSYFFSTKNYEYEIFEMWQYV